MLVAAARAQRRPGAVPVLVVVTGVRRGELCGLQIRDIDLDPGLVHVAFNYVVRDGQQVRKDTNPHQDRWLAIDPATCALIANYLDEIRVALAAVGVGLRDDAYLFSNDPVNARPWNPNWVTHQIAAAADAAGWNSTSRAGGITTLASSWPAASTCVTPPPGSATAGAARPRWGTTPTRSRRLTDEPPYFSRSRPPDLLCHLLSLDLAVRHGWAERAGGVRSAEDTCDKRPHSDKASIGCFDRETLLSSERGHRRTPAAAEERADHFGALCANTASKVCGPKSCGEGHLEASPYVRYVSVLGPNCGCEALQYHSAHLVGERQLTLQDLAVEAA